MAGHDVVTVRIQDKSRASDWAAAPAPAAFSARYLSNNFLSTVMLLQ